MNIAADWREMNLWYVVQTHAKSEHIAAAGLTRSGEIEVYCPRLRFQRLTRRGKVWYPRRSFPVTCSLVFGLRDICVPCVMAPR